MNKQSILIFVLPLLFLSCVSYEKTTEFASFPIDYPVSASASIYWQGKTITDSNYEVVEEFQFMKRSRQSLKKGSSSIPVDLQNELDQYLAKSNADGFVDLSIELIHTGSTDVNLIILERTVSILGMLAPTPVIIANSGDLNQLTKPNMLGYFAGCGALFGGSFLHQYLGHVYFVYRIEGKVVKYK